MENCHCIGIVDDDLAVRESIHLLLEAQGFQVSEYISAADYLKNARPDCLLLVDLSMGDLDGLDLIDLLRDGDIETPVIFLIDIAEPHIALRLSAISHCARLNKPVTASALLSAIGAATNDGYCASRHT